MSGGFLARWSRRKRGEDGPEPDAAPGSAPPPGALPASPPEVDPPDAPGLPAAGLGPLQASEPGSAGPAALPSLEDLARDGDLGPFLRPDVPRSLRRAALRRAWTLDPTIRDFVGPADYAWDFNAADGIPGFSLELGGNLPELLAQAVGAPAPPRPPPSGMLPGEPPAGAAPEERPAGAPTSPEQAFPEQEPAVAVAAPEQPIWGGPAASDAPAPTVAARSEAADPVPAAFAAPRRHGGAVPG